jgi:hypothetical protein
MKVSQLIDYLKTVQGHWGDLEVVIDGQEIRDRVVVDDAERIRKVWLSSTPAE